jgi:hypothetical protein
MEGRAGGAKAGGGEVFHTMEACFGGFPHNGNVFPAFSHTMEAGFGHFSTQWKYVSPDFSMVWKTEGGACPAGTAPCPNIALFGSCFHPVFFLRGAPLSFAFFPNCGIVGMEILLKRFNRE